MDGYLSTNNNIPILVGGVIHSLKDFPLVC